MTTALRRSNSRRRSSASIHANNPGAVYGAPYVEAIGAWSGVGEFGEGGDNGLEVGVHPIVRRD